MAEDLNDERRRDEEGRELLPQPARRPGTLPEPRPEPAKAEVDFPREPVPPSTFAPRFRMLTGALVGVAIGALAATLLLVAGGSPRSEPAWSNWKPSDRDAADGAEQIAKHVGSRYRLPGGGQLVLVTGGNLKVAGLDLPVRIALDEGASAATSAGAGAGAGAGGGGAGLGATPGSGGGDEQISLVKGDTVMYQLCGLGPRCAIAKGKPSTERFLLLRREALELALYSFRYLKGVDNVVALLPPAPGKKPENALFFRKRDYEPALDRPLNFTLPSPPPTLRSLPDSPEATQIERLTNDSLFVYSFQQSQDLSAFLVLARRPAD